MTDTGRLIPRRRDMHPVPYDPEYKTSVTRSPNLPLLSLESTPSEETGPRFGHGLIGALDNNLILNFSKGAAPAIVKDTYFAPLDPNFGGCGRTLTDENGYYEFLTIRPGAYPWPNRGNDWRPMHIHVSVFGHSFGQRLITQLYFEGDPLIARCPIAATVKDRGQLDQLVAPLDMGASRPMDYLAYRFDIVLRGRRQTMFENKLEGM
jgi:protocatechuate 3,4-dioxygenase, beta subunit